MKQLHEQVAECRKSKGITQRHIEKRTGIDHKRLSNIEVGRVRMRADEFLMICNTIGVSPNFFTDAVLDNKTE